MEEKTTCPNLSFFNDYITANKQHFKDPPAKQVGRVNVKEFFMNSPRGNMKYHTNI
ncbi:hypothetical protein Syun_020462 [Stephania yunnanensis]|uniref:Uncharacterized protein n=1 Tax=Stephania yunnanensis TaxID=152371 RepID=A0AAP0NQ15_9MAGN